MSDLLTAIQIACIVLLTIGAPADAVLRLYWRAATAGISCATSASDPAA